MIRPPIACLLVPLLAFAACDETDAVAVRIRLNEDLSGTVRTSGLLVPASDGPVTSQSRGATWESRVDIACAAGSFASLSQLKIADISFGAGEGGEGIGFARVVLPRGESVGWPKAFVPLTAEERAQVASALDPTSGRAEDVGATVKIEIELPSAVVGNGLTGKTRGSRTNAEGTVATLVVPIDTVATSGDPIVWHLTWQK